MGYFFYNGGGDSQDTTLKLSHFLKSNLDIKCIGLPKLPAIPITENCPTLVP